MKFVIYGIEVKTSTTLPLERTPESISDQKLLLHLDKECTLVQAMPYAIPSVNLHGQSTQLRSNLPFSDPRSSPSRVWQLVIEKRFVFTWSNHQREMCVETLGGEGNSTKLLFWLSHTVMPVYMMLAQGDILLHASAVEVGGKAILFIAPSYGGKSTLADFFVQQGHRLLSDDKIRIVLTPDGYFAYPSYPYRRTTRDFETLGTLTERYCSSPLPVGGVFLLSFVESDEKCSIQLIGGLHKFEVLQQAYLYEPISISTTEMQYLLKFSGSVQLYQINVPKEIERLNEVYYAVVDQITSGHTND